MSLTSQDIKLIEVIIEKGNEDLRKDLTVEIKKSEERLESKIKASEERTIKTINREIEDLAETNRLFIDKFDTHELRIKRLEVKTGIA